MPNEWKPDQPLPDKDDEAECQREAMARARVKHLTDSYSTQPPPAPKKKKGIFSDRD